MKTIFILSEFANENSNSTGYYWNRIANFLSLKRNSKIVVLATDLDDFSLTSCKKLKIRTPKINKHSVFQRIYYQVVLTSQFSWFILSQVRRGDIIFSGTNPAGLLIVGALLKKILRFEWIVLAYDVYPEVMVAGGLLKKSSGWIYGGLSYLFGCGYREIDKLIAIGADMKFIISRNKRISQNKIIVVQNWANDDAVKSPNQGENAIEKKLKLGADDFIFTFFGNMGRLQGVPNLLEAARRLKIPEIKILFIGTGYYKKEVERASNDPERENVLYYGELVPEKKQDGLTVGDVAIVSLAKGMYGLGVPSKAYFSMLADKPILAVMDENSEISLMLERHHIGWTCAPDDPDSLASLMESIYINRNTWRAAMRPRQALEDFYSETAALEKIYRCLYSDSISA